MLNPHCLLSLVLFGFVTCGYYANHAGLNKNMRSHYFRLINPFRVEKGIGTLDKFRSFVWFDNIK